MWFIKFVVLLTGVLIGALLIKRGIPILTGIGIGRVFGPCMEPNIHDGDRIIIKKVSKKERFRVGEIYAFRAPPHYDNIYTPAKRLDRILPDGRLYFLGDNASNSYDSRYFGAVEPQHVKYRVLYIIHRRRKKK